MEDSSSGPCNSPSKNWAEDREIESETVVSQPKPQPSKKLKANHTFDHDEFTRYKYTVSGGR